MIITEEPIWYPIYADTNNNEFEKSTLLTELDEEEEEELGQYGRKKHKGYSLKNLEISEISLCRSGKVNAGKYLIQKGDENSMDEEKELKGWEDVSESEILKIRETILILSKYDLGNDLKRAKETLTKYFGESEVKKNNDKVEWASVQKCVLGFCESDLAMVSESDLYEIEKGSPDDKFPSLTKQFNLNRARLERAYEEYELEGRLV
ncbi:hypothetical protein ES705_27147 [subsurface metagenome]